MLRVIDERVWAFVNKSENELLRAGTGSFSTPFRGRLFGHDTIRTVDAELASGRRVDALWLGSNPNVPASVEAILDPSNSSLAGAFERHLRSGRYGDDSGWDPLDGPKGGWAVYSDAFERANMLPGTAMANLIPWGSSKTTEFLGPLTRQHPDLARRVCDFSNELYEMLIEHLRPRVIVVPRSLSESRELTALCPKLPVLRSNIVDKQHHSLVTSDSGRRTHWYSGRTSSGLPALLIPHPSSLRASAEGRTELARALAEQLRSVSQSH